VATLTRAQAPAEQRRLPVRTRDRRPALAALALLLVLGGALGSALIVYRSGDRVEVLVAADTIQPGQVVDADDFTTASVAADGAGYVVAEARGNFVGTTATYGIPAGTIINREMFLAGTTVPPGADIVGVVLNPQQRPADGVEIGDVVRAFVVPRAESTVGGGEVAGIELVSAALVTEVAGGGSDVMQVSLLVPREVAPTLVAGSAVGQVAVTRLSADTRPVVDFVRE
jgi:SAF domain